MASNNELLLSVVNQIEKRLVLLLNAIGEDNGIGIRGEIKKLQNYKNDDCGITKERMEYYKKKIGYKDDESGDTPPGDIPADDSRLKLNIEDIENYVKSDLKLSEKGREYFSESAQSIAVKPKGEDAGQQQAQQEDAGQQGGYKVKTLFYKKGDSVSVMKKETEQDESNREDEFFRYYTIESDNDIYLHVVKDDGQNESELDEDDVKRIMDAGYRESDGSEINLSGEKGEDGIDRVNKFVIQVNFKEGGKVTSIPVWDSSLITTRTGEISKIFLEKNNEYKSGYFMFHFPFGKIVNSLNDDEGLNKLRSISQRMRGGEGEDGNAVINFYITLYGYTSDPTKFGEKILSFNFQVLSENNPLYANNVKYQPESDEMTLEKYLKNYVVVGSPGQQSVIKRDLPVDPQPPEGLQSPGGLQSPVDPQLGPVPSPAPMPQGPVPTPAPMPQEPLPSKGPRPQPGKEIQDIITIYDDIKDITPQNSTIELEIAKGNLEKLNIELGKSPGETRLIIKPENYEKAKNDYLDALERGKKYNELVYQFIADTKAIASKRGKQTSDQDIINEIENEEKVKDAKGIMESLYNPKDLKVLDNAKKYIEANIAYLEERNKVVQDKLVEELGYKDPTLGLGGGKKKRTYKKKKKRRSKKKKTPIKRRSK